MVAGQAKLWRQAVAEGHEIGNHTFNHQALPALSDREIIGDIQLGFSYPLKLLRSPGGAWDSRLLRIAQSLGYSLAMWSVDSGGATTFVNAGSETIVLSVLSRIQNGDIILLHFNPNDIGALPTIIETVRQRGLQPVTISELFG